MSSLCWTLGTSFITFRRGPLATEPDVSLRFQPGWGPGTEPGSQQPPARGASPRTPSQASGHGGVRVPRRALHPDTQEPQKNPPRDPRSGGKKEDSVQKSRLNCQRWAEPSCAPCRGERGCC